LKTLASRGPNVRHRETSYDSLTGSASALLSIASGVGEFSSGALGDVYGAPLCFLKEFGDAQIVESGGNCLVVVSGSFANAQQTEPKPGATPGRPTAASQIQNQRSDQEIAHMIVGGNRNEVEIAKFARDRLQSKEAKEVATMMIKDHTEALQKFSRLAGMPAGSGAAGSDERGSADGVNRNDRRAGEEKKTDRPTATSATNPSNAGANSGNTSPAGTVPNNAAGGPGGVANATARNAQGTVTAQGQGAGTRGAGSGNTAANQSLNWQAVHQEVCEEDLAGAKKELGRYEGKEFDKAYLGHQVAAHLTMATKLKVLRRHVSSQLASEIDNALATTESHLKHIRSVMEEKKVQ
jgi:predicted outer membrane protein